MANYDTVTISGLLNAEAGSDGDQLPLRQPEVTDPVTGQPGSTRKFTLAALMEYIFRGNIIVRKNRKILGTKANGSQALIAEYGIYNEGQGNQFEQVEVGSETEHLNLNTDENGTNGNHITVDTKDPQTHAAVKKVIAYMDDLPPEPEPTNALLKTGGAMTGTLEDPAAAQVRNISYGDEDLTPGTSSLTTGEVYFVYE
jgi:hypothetical protein